MSDSTNGGAMPVQAKPSRRLFLAAGSAAAVFATVKIAAAESVAVDPIFAAVDRHREAWRAFDAACSRTDNVVAEQEGRDVTDADEAAYDAANQSEVEAFDAFITLPPATVPGVRAAMTYFIEFETDLIPHAGERFVAALLKSPVLSIGGEA
jgi:hypothetical protein